MALTYFIDDSGQSDPPVFVLGGIGLETHRLEAFEIDWRAILATPPVVPQFKMKDCYRRDGGFKGISSEARDVKLKALANVLHRHGCTTISVCVHHDDFARHFSGRMMNTLDRPYQFLHHLVIAQAFNLERSRGNAGPVEFIFDRQQGEERSIQAAFAGMGEGLHPDIRSFLKGPPRFADDRDEMGLQAADMIAWHIRRSWDGAGSIAGASAAGPALQALVSRHTHLDDRELGRLSGTVNSAIRDLHTVFPYEANAINAAFPWMASSSNLQVLTRAQPFETAELISFPATGTARFLLVRSCALLGKPHLHKRDGNVCRGPETAV